MRNLTRPSWFNRLPRLSYAVAALAVTVAVIADLLLVHVLQASPTLFVFLCAIIFAAWFGGVGPGLAATVLSILAFDYFFLPPIYSFGLLVSAFPRLALFTTAALFVVGLIAVQRDTAESLLRSRADLEDKVRDLESLNAALQIEGAERQRAEKQARKMEHDLQTMIDMIPAKIAVYQADGTTRQSSNLPWCDYTGLSVGDKAAARSWAVTHPDDVKATAAKWTACLAKLEPFQAEVRLRRRDGVYRWHMVHRVPLRNQSGDVTKWYAVAFDIEDRRRAEDALRQSEAYLAEAQRLSHTGSFGWYVSSGDIIWSAENYRIFAYDPTTKITIDRVFDRVHPEDVAFTREVIERATADKVAFDFEHRLLMPDGSVKHLNVVAHPLIDGPGGLQFVGAVMDITARKLAEEALRERSQLLDLTHDTIFVRGMDDVISLWNRGAEQLYGWDKDEALGHTSHQLLRTIFPAPLEEITSELLSTGHWEGELVHTKRDGTQVTVASRWSLQQDEHGRPVGILETNNDITERVRAQEMLQRVQADFAHAARVAMLGELTVSIAHEVNQPLAAIVINGEVGLRLLDRSEPDLAEVREVTKCVVDDARRAADVIARARTMATRQSPERAVLSVDEVIGEALLFLRHEVQSHGLIVTHHSNPMAPKVLGDRTQLQQVFVNLTVNAIQAMAQTETMHRTLAIRTTLSDPGTCVCTFEDSGPGIKPEHLDRLFDSFFTTKAAGTGMGLGLAISRSIIEAHGGRIQADNQSAYGGARFTFTLPEKRETTAGHNVANGPGADTASRSFDLRGSRVPPSASGTN
jgi:PAS domain S-box-containing protein